MDAKQVFGVTCIGLSIVKKYLVLYLIVLMLPVWFEILLIIKTTFANIGSKIHEFCFPYDSSIDTYEDHHGEYVSQTVLDDERDKNITTV